MKYTMFTDESGTNNVYPPHLNEEGNDEREL